METIIKNIKHYVAHLFARGVVNDFFVKKKYNYIMYNDDF
jgi:hypothetical protein